MKYALIAYAAVIVLVLTLKPTPQSKGPECGPGVLCIRDQKTVQAELRETPKPLRPVHTFSIVARDTETGEMGVAVQSHWFSVGSIVTWAEAGVGAVATQSFVDPSYGKLGLDLMRAGKSAPEALTGLLAGDEGRQVRQVAMIDTQGKVAVWTGCKDIQAAGDHAGNQIEGGALFGDSGCKSQVHLGTGYSTEANLMSNDKVWPAMAKAYESTKGDLADRMLAALDAAQAVGGDIRGRQSAALVIVKAKPSGKPWEDRIFDLRVDDAVEPLKELRKLVVLQRAYNHMNAGDLAVEHKDNEAALREYATAEKLTEGAAGVDPSRLAEMRYWHAVALVNMGRVDESLPIFQKVFATPGIGENWRTLTPRLPKSGLLPDDAKLIQRITAAR
ncbi:MAG: DUF1028 domain-containing protein [Acidobacteriia bacterium]|nr:DUF1028 domain-containing protein [Terriglobia bacterium]